MANVDASRSRCVARAGQAWWYMVASPYLAGVGDAVTAWRWRPGSRLVWRGGCLFACGGQRGGALGSLAAHRVWLRFERRREHQVGEAPRAGVVRQCRDRRRCLFNGASTSVSDPIRTSTAFCRLSNHAHGAPEPKASMKPLSVNSSTSDVSAMSASLSETAAGNDFAKYSLNSDMPGRMGRGTL